MNERVSRPQLIFVMTHTLKILNNLRWFSTGCVATFSFESQTIALCLSVRIIRVVALRLINYSSINVPHYMGETSG